MVALMLTKSGQFLELFSVADASQPLLRLVFRECNHLPLHDKAPLSLMEGYSLTAIECTISIQRLLPKYCCPTKRLNRSLLPCAEPTTCPLKASQMVAQHMFKFIVDM